MQSNKADKTEQVGRETKERKKMSTTFLNARTLSSLPYMQIKKENDEMFEKGKWK